LTEKPTEKMSKRLNKAKCRKYNANCEVANGKSLTCAQIRYTHQHVTCACFLREVE